MTKCVLFWKKVQEFKGNDDFEGFREWCGYKSYEQARRDWNAFDTLLIVARKLGKDVCELVTSDNLTEKALQPIVHHRTYVGKHETIPSPIQERAIDYLLPKIKNGTKITEEDSKRAVSKALGEEMDSSREPQTPRIDVDTGFKFECPICHKHYMLIHIDPSGKHKFESVEVMA